MSVKNPELIPLFEEIKKIMQEYAKYFTVVEGDGAYHLIYKGEVVFDKYKRDEVYFASILIQKNFVGFYFMPQYTTEHDPSYFSGDALMKLLKGKSCYNITQKAYDHEIAKQLKEALDIGLKCYQEKGWTQR